MRAICNGFSKFSAAIDSPADASDEVVWDMSAKALFFELILVLAGLSRVPLIAWAFDCGDDIISESCVVVMVANFEVSVPKSCAMDMRPIEAIGELSTIVIILVGVGIDANVNTLAVTTTGLEYILILSSSLVETFRCNWAACSCLATAVWNGRAWQARMPSCHV